MYHAQYLNNSCKVSQNSNIFKQRPHEVHIYIRFIAKCYIINKINNDDENNFISIIKHREIVSQHRKMYTLLLKQICVKS